MFNLEVDFETADDLVVSTMLLPVDLLTLRLVASTTDFRGDGLHSTISPALTSGGAAATEAANVIDARTMSVMNRCIELISVV